MGREEGAGSNKATRKSNLGERLTLHGEGGGGGEWGGEKRGRGQTKRHERATWESVLRYTVRGGGGGREEGSGSNKATRKSSLTERCTPMHLGTSHLFGIIFSM